MLFASSQILNLPDYSIATTSTTTIIFSFCSTDIYSGIKDGFTDAGAYTADTANANAVPLFGWYGTLCILPYHFSGLVIIISLSI